MSDTDADAWAADVISSGGTVSAAQDFATQALCVGLKADSVFAKLNFLWPFWADTSVGCYIDLIARLHGSPVNSPTFTSKAGVAFNPGGSQYFNCNTAGGTAQNSAAFGLDALNDQPAQDSIAMGASGGVGQHFIAQVNLEWSDNLLYFAVNDSNADGGRAAPADKRGVWIFNRTVSGQADAYQSGSLFANNGQTSSVTPVTNFCVGACIDADGLVGAYATLTAGMAVIADGLTATDISNFNTRWTTYKTDLVNFVDAPRRDRVYLGRQAVTRAARY